MSRRESIELTVLCLVHRGGELLLQNRVNRSVSLTSQSKNRGKGCLYYNIDN